MKTSSTKPQAVRASWHARNLRLIPWLLGGSLLTSCAMGPGNEPRPQALAAASLRTEKSFAAPQADWPTRAWWSSFQDEQLNRLMAEALAHSPSMAQARARLQVAEARAGGARSALYPSLSADGGISDQKLTYNGIFPQNAVPRGWNDMGQVGLGLGWEIDFWGKNRAALAAALSEAGASQADAAGARLLLTTALAGSYVGLQDAYTRRDIAEAVLRNRRDSEQLVSRRAAQGLDSQESVDVAKARISLAQADVAELGESVELIENGIAALLGQGPDRGLSIERPRLMAQRTFGLPGNLKLNLIGRKPEIVAARLRVEAAAKRTKVAKASFYPNVNLVGLIGFESLGLNRLFAAGSDTGAIGPAVDLPIFEGGKLRANLRRADAEYDLAVAAYDGVLIQAFREAADAARSLQDLPARQSFVDLAVKESSGAERLARQRYEGGLSDYQSVLTAEDTALRAENAANRLQMRGLALEVALVKALGGGFEAASVTRTNL